MSDETREQEEARLWALATAALARAEAAEPGLAVVCNLIKGKRNFHLEGITNPGPRILAKVAELDGVYALLSSDDVPDLARALLDALDRLAALRVLSNAVKPHRIENRKAREAVFALLATVDGVPAYESSPCVIVELTVDGEKR